MQQLLHYIMKKLNKIHKEFHTLNRLLINLTGKEKTINQK